VGKAMYFSATLALTALVTLPGGALGQNPAQTRPPRAPQLDSLRARLYNLNQEQMEEVRRVLEARQEEFDAIRRAMQEELQQNAARLDEARREYEAVRQQSAQVRQQAEAALQEALQERQRIVREQFDGLPRPLLGDPALPFVTGGDRMFVWPDSAFVLRGDSLKFLRGQPGFGPDQPWDLTIPPITVGIPGLGGQRFVAGVELTNLNPSLARYFQVDGGVLVTAVTEGSPGDRAGLLAGDVLVEVAGEPVGTVQEVRQAMNRNSPARVLERSQGGFEVTSPEPLTLRVIREGQPLDLEIPR